MNYSFNFDYFVIPLQVMVYTSDGLVLFQIIVSQQSVDTKSHYPHKQP